MAPRGSELKLHVKFAHAAQGSDIAGKDTCRRTFPPSAAFVVLPSSGSRQTELERGDDSFSNPDRRG